MKQKHLLLLALVGCGLWHNATPASAQGTAFTYQGRLDNLGAPAMGIYDLQFALYDSTNIPGTLISGPLTNSATPVSNGLFSVELDFGAAAFTGAPLWLQIAVRTNGAADFTALSPRQPLTPSPYAITAGSVVSNGLAAGAYANAVTFGNAANQFTGSYSGNGAGLTNIAGAVSVQTVAGSTVQAAPNTSYILTNNSQTTIVTLPPAPNVGDVVGVANTGLHGWQLAQNPGQIVLANTLAGPSPAWAITGAPTNKNWRALASSADGTYLLASESAAPAYASADAGNTWSVVPAVANNAPVTVSSDGSRMAIATPAQQIWTSGNLLASGPFPGTNWAATAAPSTNWSGIASSADGSRLTAVIKGGGIYLSSDFGSNWAPSLAPSNYWTAVAASADGSHLAATSAVGIYTSSNFGTNWSLSVSTNLGWVSIASSLDGTGLAAAAASAIYLSTDSGAFWVPANTPTNVSGWSAIACSADGTRIVASAGTAGVWLSIDAGVTWAPAAGLPATTWQAVTSTAAGTFLAGVFNSGAIYISKTATTAGPAGYLSGGPNTAVELRYTGNSQFLPINHEGTMVVH